MSWCVCFRLATKTLGGYRARVSPIMGWTRGVFDSFQPRSTEFIINNADGGWRRRGWLRYFEGAICRTHARVYRHLFVNGIEFPPPPFLQWYDMKLWTVLLGRKVERGCFAVARHELKTYTRLWILVSTLCTTYKRRLLLLRLRVASRYLSIRVCEWKIIKRSFSVWISLSSSLVSCCSRDWISKLCREGIFFFFKILFPSAW